MSYDSLTDIHSCYIGTKSSSQNSLDEWTYTWTYSSTETKCRMSPITAKERIELPGKYEDVSFRGFFKSGTSITISNRIRYNSADYRIRELYYDSSRHHISTMLSKM